MKARNVQPMERERYLELFQRAQKGLLTPAEQEEMVLEVSRLRGIATLTRDALQDAESYVGGQDVRRPGTLPVYQLLREARFRLEGEVPEVAALHLPGAARVAAFPPSQTMEPPDPRHAVVVTDASGRVFTYLAPPDEAEAASRLTGLPVSVTVLLTLLPSKFQCG